jgi:hypothetical protein
VTRASNEAGATIAARRLLVLAGAVAGFWLVSWLVSGHAQAAARDVNPIGEVVAGVLGGQSSGGALSPGPESGTRSGGGGVPAGVVEPVSRAVRAAVPDSPVVRAAAPASDAGAGSVASAVEPVSHGVRAAAPVVEPISRVVRSAAPVVEPISQAVRAAAPAIEPVSRVVRAAAPAIEPVPRVVRAAESVVEPVVRSVGPALEPISQVVRAVEPVSRLVHTVVEPVVRSVAPVLNPVTQVLRTAAPVLDPVLGAVRTVAVPVVEPVADLLTPVTRPVVDPVVQPIVAAEAEGGAPIAPGRRTALPALTPARQAKAAPPHQETTPTAITTALDRTYNRPSPGVEPVSAPVRATHHTTVSQPAGAPGNAPSPQSPVPADAACGTAPTIPPAFLTTDLGPRVMRAFTRSQADFVPLWRACEPGTGPG